MKKRFFYPLLVSLFFPLFVFAQNDFVLPCQLSPEAEASITARLMENKKTLNGQAFNRVTTTFVPVKIHLVADNNGEGRMSEGKALDMLCILNEEFAEADIQFFLKDEFSYPNSSAILNHTNFDVNPGAIWNLSNAFKVNNAINIFVTNNVGDGVSGGTTLAYYAPVNDCIFIRQASVYGRNVLAHEVGHFFSLQHTFLGWEEDPFFCEGQVDVNSPGCLSGTIENQSGSNCETAADMICDTPPDYLFGFCPQTQGCTFNGVVFDCEGSQIFPMEDNMMAYFSSCNDYQFTPMQIEVMNVDLLSPQRANINPGITPNLDEIAEVPSVISPINGAEVSYNAFELQWEAVPGATHYYVELDQLNNFSFKPLRRIVTTNSLFVGDFCQPNKTYYWRVRAFNEFKGLCGVYSTVATLETNAIASKVTQVEGLDNWSVRPNPASTNEAIYVDLQTAQPMETSVNVYSVTGQLMSSVSKNIAAGAITFEVNTADLATGIYLVSIQTATGVSTKRLVIR